MSRYRVAERRHGRFWMLVLSCIYLANLQSARADVTPANYVSQETPAQHDARMEWWRDLGLHYDAPAMDWMRGGLPIGNGQMGAMLYGSERTNRIQFNEESLWLGNEEDTGKYQDFGEITFTWNEGEITNYTRSLDIASAIHRASWIRGGARITQEAFASFPAKVIVVRWTTDKPGAISGKLELADAHGATTEVVGNTLTIAGEFPGYTYGDGKQWLPLHREAQVRVLHTGGSLVATNGEFVVDKADSLTLLLAAGTDFKQDRAANWRGALPHDSVSARLAAAAKKSCEELLAEHVRDYRHLFDRVKLTLDGKVTETATDTRLRQYQPDDPDLGLEELLFQYGRYLMISSSREGCLPANLQGKWNDNNDPPWRCDYHTDINVEMNYWMTDVANLSECFEPFAKWIDSIRSVRTEATKKAFGVRGWTSRGESGLFGGATWNWVPASSAWLLQNDYDHYRFTMDKAYLRDFAYPAMKEVCEFWLDRLETLPDGTLVAPKSFSPEQMHTWEKGVTFEQELIWDLFTSTIEASKILGVDASFRTLLSAKRGYLLLPKIGKWGQLQEWMSDLDNPEDHHRHVSHLFAVHPGRQITVRETPFLAQAAKGSLNARGDDSTGWSTVWKINLWARLHDGDHAHKLFRYLIRECRGTQMANEGGGLYGNLLDACPPFEIDGNFGYVNGVCEMLLQSHTGEIELLPALPAAWPNGKVTGLRARGGFELEVSWEHGILKAATIYSLAGQPCRVRYGAKVIALNTKAGQTYDLKFD